jgi:hyperosmotically inducible periplasmic protein
VNSLFLVEEIMRKGFRAPLIAALLAIPLGFPLPAANVPQKQEEPKNQQQLVKEVRHQLVLLPYYSVFDNLEYRVDGDRVILEGQVTRPTLKSDAEAAVKSIEGISSVQNNIEVLPPSPMDDQTRRAVYRAIYGDPSLSKYGWSAIPSIHIIVKNGHVTLVGVVDNDSDKNLANIRTSTVPNVFTVKNDLVVGGQANSAKK